MILKKEITTKVFKAEEFKEDLVGDFEIDFRQSVQDSGREDIFMMIVKLLLGRLLMIFLMILKEISAKVFKVQEFKNDLVDDFEGDSRFRSWRSLLMIIVKYLFRRLWEIFLMILKEISGKVFKVLEFKNDLLMISN